MSLGNHKDFEEELTALEYIAQEMSSVDCCVTVIFTPKYHCEIAGEGIELCWGFLKKYYRRKFTVEQKKKDFSGCIDKALSAIPLDTVRKYAGRVYSYMMAYKKAIEEQDETVSYATIEKLMKQHKSHRSSLDPEDAILEEDVAAAL